MAVLIDPPLWPAHGTRFSHLVSDASLAELQDFAAAASISPRAFDRDHYDVPLSQYERLVMLGARPVSAGELTRSLIRAGLRVPARERADRHDKWLRRDLEALLPGSAATADAVLAAWSGPERHYHDRRHLAQVLRALDELTGAADAAAPGAPSRDVAAQVAAARLAAWWHDAVYRGEAGADELASADLAVASLTPHVDALVGAPGAERVRLDAGLLARTHELILMTAGHQPGDDPAGALLSDADLRVLARPQASYDRYVADVRLDYAHVSDADFAQGRAAVLTELLGQDRLFHTRHGLALWEAAARENLERELSQLRSA